MNVDTKTYAVGLIELLHYELSHPAYVSENEMIGALALAHRNGEGNCPGGQASDKTLYIALNYQARTDHMNGDAAEEVVRQLMALEREQERLKYDVSLLRTRHAVLLKLLCFEGYSQERCAKKLEIATRTVRRIKDEALDELTEMYSFAEGAANRCCPESVQ